MTCSGCGAYVTPSVRFCSNCGAPTDNEATKIARLQARALEFNSDTDLEHTVFTVRPTMIFIKAGYAAAVLGGVALVFLLASIGVPASISIPLALALLLIPAFYHVRRNMVRYTVTDSKLQIDTGLIAADVAQRRSFAPLAGSAFSRSGRWDGAVTATGAADWKPTRRKSGRWNSSDASGRSSGESRRDRPASSFWVASRTPLTPKR